MPQLRQTASSHSLQISEHKWHASEVGHETQLWHEKDDLEQGKNEAEAVKAKVQHDWHEEDEEGSNANRAKDGKTEDDGETEDGPELNNGGPVRWQHSLAWQEVYKDRAPVIYWSSTHQMMMQASIFGRGRFRSNELMPCYSVEVGWRRQLRKRVPLGDLHPALQDGDAVVFLDPKSSIWKPGIITKVLHSYGIFDVQISGDSGEAEVHQDISLDRIRKRYCKDLPVQVYQGRHVGWLPGSVYDEPKQGGNCGIPPSESMFQEVQVLLDGAEEPVSIASYLIQMMEFVEMHL